MRFHNRTDAGHKLASHLSDHAGAEDLVVLGLPRGGVPVASAVAEQLGVPLGTFTVRKVGVPGHEELAMGAVASGGITVQNEEVVEHLGVPPEVFEEAAEAQRREVKRRQRLYQQEGPPQTLHGKKVILTDDGLATGATMRAAVEAVRKTEPRQLIVAVPIANQIVGALKRNILIDAELIDVRVTNGVVTLSGSVPNWAALRAARSAAYRTAGAVDVRDNLVVSG